MESGVSDDGGMRFLPSMAAMMDLTEAPIMAKAFQKLERGFTLFKQME
jgi:hypothetical protein